jgi:hypothetical protein
MNPPSKSSTLAALLLGAGAVVANAGAEPKPAEACPASSFSWSGCGASECETPESPNYGCVTAGDSSYGYYCEAYGSQSCGNW